MSVKLKKDQQGHLRCFFPLFLQRAVGLGLANHDDLLRSPLEDSFPTLTVTQSIRGTHRRQSGLAKYQSLF